VIRNNVEIGSADFAGMIGMCLPTRRTSTNRRQALPGSATRAGG
jgi:hypothetical protein